MGLASPDVLIVGGGPAGLAAAIALRQRGASVTVADAMPPPIEKTCGEGLMPDARRELTRLGVDLTSSDGAEFRGIRFINHAPEARSSRTDAATAQFPTPHESGNWAGIGLRRQTLHARLVERAQQIGVRFRWQSVVQLHGQMGVEGDGNAGVLVAGEPVRYGCLIGADGLASRVRGWAGLERGSILSRRFGFRQHFAVRPWSPYVEVHWSDSGQAYVTPVGPNEVCVATIARDSQCRLGNVLEEMPWLQEQLCGRQMEPVALDRERGAITMTRRLRRVSRGRVALLGDASGSADAITGEGMAMSFRQALLLADCLAEKTPVTALADYNRQHPKTVHLPQTIAGLMLGMDRSATFRNRAIRMLAAEPQLFARMLGVHVGSESLLRFIAAQGVNVVWRLAVPIDVKPAQSRLSA